MSPPSLGFPLLALLLLLTGCGRGPVEKARRGVEALNREEPGKAAARLEDALAEWPAQADPEHTARLHGALALAQYRRNPDAPGIEEHLRRAAQEAPNSFNALYNLGVWLADHDQAEEGRRLLERAAEADPSRTEAFEVLAGRALRRGDHTTAIDWLERARSRRETASILTALAVARKNTSPAAELRALTQRAVSLDRSDPQAHLSLAAVLDQHRLDPEQAISHYEEFLRLAPDSIHAARVGQRVQIMAARLESGRFAQPDPIRREVETLLAEAKTAARNGDAGLALRKCLQANLAAGRASRSDLKERALRAAVTLAPESPRGHYGLGRFLLEQGLKEDALERLREAQRLAPEWPPALAATVSLASDLRERGVARNALALAEEAALSNPGYLLRIGELYAEALDDRREAKRIYRIWLERFPDDDRLPEVEARL